MFSNKQNHFIGNLINRDLHHISRLILTNLIIKLLTLTSGVIEIYIMLPITSNQ